METKLSNNNNTFNLVKQYINEFEKIFNLYDNNNTFEYEDDLKFCFKVLIFDDKAYDILFPLCKIYLLRKYNIAYTLNINDKRDKIEDIMAIYIISNSEYNYNILAKDIEKKNFSNFSINIINYDSSENNDKEILNNFYNSLANIDDLSIIFNVKIIPINLILYTQNIFNIGIKRPYLLLNTPNVSEEKSKEYLSQISNGIFSCLYLLKCMPIVKYRSGYFAEDIIKKLQEQFKFLLDKVPEMKDDFKLKKNNERTLLIILERDLDLPIMLHHACSYGAMINDHFGISIGGSDKNNNNIEKLDKYDIDPIHDYIWNEKIHEIFVDVGNYIYAEYKKFYKEMDYLDNINGPKDMEQLKNESEKLAKSIESLKDMKLLGKILENETKFYEKLSKIQKEKKLDKLFNIECAILKKREKIAEQIKKEVREIMSNNKDNENLEKDIERLGLIYYLCYNKMSLDEFSELRHFLKSSKALTYLKSKIDPKSSNKNTNNKDKIPSLLFTSIYNAVDSFSSLISIAQPSISADLVSKLATDTFLNGWNTYNFHTASIEKDNKKYTYKNVICFFVGGGGLGEFEYIRDMLNEIGINVIYGADCIYRPIEFKEDLEELGKNDIEKK